MKTLLRVFFLTVFFLPGILNAQCPVLNFGPDTTICVGTAITLNAENPGATYLWNDGSTTPQLTTFFEGEYSVEVTLNGCVARDTIYVQQGAVIFADFNYSQNTTCSPFLTQFNEFSQACSGSVVDWTWNFGDGTFSKENNPLHSYAVPGDYLVTLTVKNNNGAIYSAQQTLTIDGNMTPVVDLGNDSTLCDGNIKILSAGNTGAQFLWSTGETTQSISVFDGGKYKVSVTNNGCTAEDSMNVVSLPVLWSDFVFTKVSDCLPVKYQFTDKSSSCDGNITDWFWEFGDGSTSTSQNPMHEFAADGQNAVKLTISDNNGNSIRRSKKVNIQSSTATVNIGPDTTICFGSSVTLNAGNPGYTYLWSTGETTQQITVMDDGNYSVVIQNGGCEAKDTVTVKTSASITTGWTYSRDGECLPVPVHFSDTSKVYCGQTITGWSWDFGDGNYSTEQNPVHEYISADSFLVKLTIHTSNGSNGSKTTRIGISNTLYQLDMPSSITVCTGQSANVDAGITDAEYLWTPTFGVSDPSVRNPSITPLINSWYTVQVTKCMVNLRDSVYLVVDSLPKPFVSQSGNILKCAEAPVYQWYRDGKKIGGAKGKTLRIDRQGYYSVMVSNKSGCERQSDTRFCIPQSRDEDNEETNVKCSPNPAHGTVSILLSDIPEQPAKVVVYDGHGSGLYKTYIRNHVNTLSTMKLTAGLYFVEITISKKKRILPLIVQ
jgi:PKD repeat protein